ncbi:MAG: DnaJ C-terminal domain-containing protein [Pseudomonadota bacterium]
MSWDPYAVLGVSKSASDDEIKRAYRQKAKALHPDQHPGDAAKAEQFKRASAAFELLKDAGKRAQYDRGEIDADGQVRHFGGVGAGAGPMGGGDAFEDILSGLFGGGRNRRGPGPRKGRDIRYRVEVDFEDAVIGAQRRIKMSDGQSLDVNIPAGVETGQTLRLKSQGERSPYGGPPGDALVELVVKEHKVWRREGDDLHMALPISLSTAVLGGVVDVVTPSGSVSLKIPDGSNTGAILRLRGKGVQRSAKPGHLYARLEIVLADPKDAALKTFAKKYRAK